MRRFVLIGAAAGMLAWTGCRRSAGPGALELSGTLELTEHSVGTRAAGRLVELPFKEGQPVKKGQRLALLDRHEQSRRDYERARRLYEKGGGSLQSVEHARLAMEDEEVLSPVDGVVLTKVREAGEVVPAGAAVAVIGDAAELWVRIYVPEGSVNRVRLGQAASIRFDGLSRSFRGRVTFVAPRAEFTPRNVQTPEERVSQTFAVKVALEERDPSLRPGVAADVSLDLEQRP